MATWLVVVLYVVTILVIILVHEAGHFVTAKAFKIKVQEFFVGFGPRLWSFRRGETEYGVKALPFGGYVRIAGMNPFEEVPQEEVPRTFGAKPAWQRAVVIGAGPVTHFVMAILVLGLYFAAIGTPLWRPHVDCVQPTLGRSDPNDPCRTIGGPESPAARAGLRSGDVVVAIQGRPVPATGDPGVSNDFVRGVTRKNSGQPVSVTVVREGRRIGLTATPVVPAGEQQARLGVLLGAQIVGRDRTGPAIALGRAVRDTGLTAWRVLDRLGEVFGPAGLKRLGQLLIGSEQRGPNDVVSVVGVGRVATEAVRVGAWDVLVELFVVFNVFVGIMNVIPLPPLDGGHLAVIAYEKIRRRRPDVRKLVPLTAVVLVFMVMFAISVAYLDIVRPLPNPFR